MNTTELDQLLQQSLADHKLSGSEKQALTGFAMKEIDSEQDRAVARSRIFEIARQAATDADARTVLTWVEAALKAIVPMRTGGSASASAESSNAFFSPGDACLRQIIHCFQAARQSADVCVFTITDDRITRAILDCRRRGVKVRVITDNDKAEDLGSDIESISNAGIEVKVDHTPYHMHHKFAVFDGTRLISGSYNWTRGAAEQNQENLIDTGDEKLIGAYLKEFERLWKSF